MPSCCLKCGANTKNIILQVSRAINGGIKILSKCAVCGDKKSKFIKKQEEKGLLNNLVISLVLNAVLVSATSVECNCIQ